MNKAAGMIHKVLELTQKNIIPGITTDFLARKAYCALQDEGADPGVIIHVSPEEIVWHGPPGSRILEEGQIVTMDIACSHHGWWADSARTFAVGSIDEKRRELMKAALVGMKEAASAMLVGSNGIPGSEKIARISRRWGVALISEGAGHGIGRRVHEPPSITYDGRPHSPLQAESVYSVEPIFTTGSGEIAISPDGSARTTDGEPSAHYEVTLIIRADGAQVLGFPEWMNREPC